MALMPIVSIVAAAAGLLWSRWRNAPAGRQLTLRAWPVLLAAAAGQVTLYLTPVGARGAVAAGDCALIAWWSFANRPRRSGLPGLLAVGAGGAANSVVIAANGGMPVSRAALAAAGLPRQLDVARGHLDRHVLMGPGTQLRWLGDAVPFAPLHVVLSAGDLVMLAGTAAAAFGVAVALAPHHAPRGTDRRLAPPPPARSRGSVAGG
jgi:hypothetical protein